MSLPGPDAPQHIYTAHSDFLLPPRKPSQPPSSLLLRGVNLTSKFPSTPPLPINNSDASNSSREERDEKRKRSAGVESHLDDAEGGIWTEAENGGREGWFVGHPLALDGAEVSSRA
jgi:hypothetical protein